MTTTLIERGFAWKNEWLVTGLNGLWALVCLLGEVKLKHLAIVAFVVVVLPFAGAIVVVWYVPITLVAWMGRRAGWWAWYPF